MFAFEDVPSKIPHKFCENGILNNSFITLHILVVYEFPICVNGHRIGLSFLVTKPTKIDSLKIGLHERLKSLITLASIIILYVVLIRS